MISPSANSTAFGAIRPQRGYFSDEVQEHYRALLRRLPCCGSTSKEQVRTLGVTSCSRGEGVSTVAAHLAAAAAAHNDVRVLLIDFNFQRPSVHRTFGVGRGPGLTEVLLDASDLLSAVQDSPVERLSLLTVGLPSDGSDCHSLSRVPQVLAAARDEFDLVIVDLPESNQESAGLPVATLLDGIVLVIEAERVRWEVAQRTTELLNRAGANLLGAVMNKRRHYVPRWLYRTL